MKQADLGLNLSTKRTRKREFLDEMNRVVPWASLVELVTPYAPVGSSEGSADQQLLGLVLVAAPLQDLRFSRPAGLRAARHRVGGSPVHR